MFKMNKKTKTELLDIFCQPNITIEQCDYTDYFKNPLEYYKVTNANSYPLIDVVVTPVMRRLARYEIIWPNNKKIACLVRPNAIFHTPMAADILEVYYWLKLRLLLQNTSQTQVKK